MKKQYLLNFGHYFLSASCIGLLTNLLFDWSFDPFPSVIQNAVVGIAFSWILTQAQQHKKKKSRN